MRVLYSLLFTPYKAFVPSTGTILARVHPMRVFFFVGCFPFLTCACFTACCLPLIKLSYLPLVVSWLKFILCECFFFVGRFPFLTCACFTACCLPLIKVLYLPLVVSWLEFILCECFYFVGRFPFLTCTRFTPHKAFLPCTCSISARVHPMSVTFFFAFVFIPLTPALHLALQPAV